MGLDQVIEFTPSQLIGFVLAICAGITCVAGAITAISNWVNKAKSPIVALTKQIEIIESRMDHYDEVLTGDNKRLSVLEEGNRVTQKALLALLSHGIDGNNIGDMEKAKKDLQDYLILR